MRAPFNDLGFVVCVSNTGYKAALQVRRLYRALPDADAARRGLIRVIDESGDDYLFPQALFAAIDLPVELRERLAS